MCSSVSSGNGVVAYFKILKRIYIYTWGTDKRLGIGFWCCPSPESQDRVGGVELQQLRQLC